ncbi:MAG: CesT family type III secretion system chaperone [Gammaproteobacteria bacterium]
MDAREQTDQFLRELGQRAGLGAVSLSAQGTCGFEIGDDLALHLEVPAAGATLHLMSTLLRAPDDGRERFLTGLLMNNYGCVETEGATLALDPGGEQVCLCLALPLAGLDYVAFENTLTNFASAARNWRERLGFSAPGLASENPAPPWLGIRV